MNLRFLTLGLICVLSSVVIAQQDEEFDDDSEYVPGVVLRKGEDVVTTSRISTSTDLVVTRSVWEGLLESGRDGDYQFAARIQGSLKVTVAGREVLNETSTKSKWVVSKSIPLSYDYHDLTVELEMIEQEAPELTLFWSGPDFRIEPLAGKMLWHRRDIAMSGNSRGFELTRRLRCEACHTIDGRGRDPIPSPNLLSARRHLRAGWLYSFLTSNPNRPSTDPLRSVHAQFSPDDAGHLAAWLSTLDHAFVDDNEGSPGDTAVGEDLFHTLGCLACHELDGVGSQLPLSGGDLSQVAQKRPPTFLHTWLRDPQEINRNHRMPHFDLDEQEIRDLASFLSSLGDDRIVEVQRRGSVAKGQRLAVQHRCTSCHGPPALLSGRSTIGASSNWAQNCLQNSGGGKPDYGTISGDDVLAIHEFVTRLSGDLGEGERLVLENNCLNCHARDDSAGLANVTTQLVKKHPEYTDLVGAMKPPMLNSIGDKLHDRVLQKSISRKGAAFRPWLHVRMPKFRLSNMQIEQISRHFIHQDRVAETAFEHVAAPTALESTVASRLVTSDGFGCTSCHAVGKVQPPSETPVNQLGPSLSMPGERVRKVWFDRWVRNPARIAANMEMPSVQIPVPHVLDGHLDKQLNAVWNILNVRRFSPPDPEPTRIVALKGVVDEQPVVLSDVLQLNGRKLVKPFLIGLPNRTSALLDLESGRLAAIWSGDVARQRTQGKTWFWEPPGIHIPELPANAEFRLVIDGKSFDPQRVGQFVIEPDRWHVKDQGIELHHRLHFKTSDSAELRVVKVVQHFVSDGARVKRRIAVSALRDGESILFRTRDAQETPTNDKIWQTGSQTGSQTQFEVSYDTTPSPIVATTRTYIEKSTQKQLRVAPGFDAMQLPVRRDVMPISLTWRPNKQLVIGSLKGRVWIVKDEDGDGFEDHMQPIGDDLASPYGLATGHNYIDVLNKFGIVRLHMRDEQVVSHELVASGWGHTDDYHDWVVGLPRDKTGNYYVSIPCQQDDRTEAAAHLRGTVLRIEPREPTPRNPRQFALHQVSAGHRFPMGIAMNRAGDVFVTDNQGNYNPFNELNHVVQDAHFGFINKLQRRPGFAPPLTAPAIDLPHPWTRSVNGICFLETPSSKQIPMFGPFEGHLVGCEYDTRRLIRMSLEEVDGGIQGAAYPFAEAAADPREGLQGPINCAIAPDGSLYIANIRDSGWGGANNTGSLVRMTPDFERLPAGISEVSLTQNGFRLRFTRPVNAALATNIGNYAISSYRRISTPIYGGDDVDRRVEIVQSAKIATDGLSVEIALPELRRGFVYEFKLRKLVPQDEFYPSEAHYTVRRLRRSR